MQSTRWFLQGNLHMQPRLPDNRYFKITKSWPPSPSSCSSPWSPPPSPPSTQSRPSWLDHDDHHNCQLPHDHHRRHAQAQRSGCAKQQGSGQTRSPTARKKVPFFNIVTIYMQKFWVILIKTTTRHQHWRNKLEISATISVRPDHRHVLISEGVDFPLIREKSPESGLFLISLRTRPPSSQRFRHNPTLIHGKEKKRQKQKQNQWCKTLKKLARNLQYDWYRIIFL